MRSYQNTNELRLVLSALWTRIFNTPDTAKTASKNKFLPTLKPAFALYPQVLKDTGPTDLLQQHPPWKNRFSSTLRQMRISAATQPRPRYHRDLAALPQFPIELIDAVRTPQRSPKSKTGTTMATDLDLLETMLTIRAFEEHLAQVHRESQIPTEAIHLSTGKEAVAAGVCLNLRQTDYLNTSHRGHGHLIAKGADLSKMMAELYGRSVGQCGGRGGVMHLTDPRRGILGANGIVGAGYLLAMGAGLTIKLQDRDDISVVISGNDSVNQGMFHEALNMTALFQLPVLIVVENDLCGEFTSPDKHPAVTEVYVRAQSYGIESERFDGNNVKTVFKRFGEIVAKMRRDGRPRLVELMACGRDGRTESEPERYHNAAELKRDRKKCPITRLQQDLLRHERATEDQLAAVKAKAYARVSKAVTFARRAESPPAETLLEHVYAPETRSTFEGEFDHPLDGEVVSVSQAINQALAEEMERDKTVFLWGEGVVSGGYFSVAKGLVQKFGPERIIDTPISENGIIGGAVGAAMTGMRPVAEIIFADFLTCCMDPIVNQAAKLRYMTGGQISIPLTIRTPIASGGGMGAQHSQSVERLFFGIPGLIVAAPSDAYTAKGLLKTAIRSQNPILFFEHRLLYDSVSKIPSGDYTLPLGRARIVRRGKDVTIVTHLLGVSVALDAAKLLASRNIQAEVIDLTTLYPIDTRTILASIRKTGRLATIEEGGATGGIGSEVIARIAISDPGLLKAPPLRLAAPECPVPYASNLEYEMLPNPKAIAEGIATII